MFVTTAKDYFKLSCCSFVVIVVSFRGSYLKHHTDRNTSEHKWEIENTNGPRVNKNGTRVITDGTRVNTNGTRMGKQVNTNGETSEHEWEISGHEWEMREHEWK